MWYDGSVAKKRGYGRNSGRRNSGDQVIGRRTAGRTYTRGSKKTKIPAGLVFWAVFLVLIAGLFFINRDQIRTSLENIRLLEKTDSVESGGAELNRDAVSGGETRPPASPAANPATSPAANPSAGSAGIPEGPADGTERTSVVQSPPRPIEQRSPPAEASPAARTAPNTPNTGSSYTDQVLYFIRVSDDGDIIRSRITRRLPVSGTPLQDTLESLITGPSSAEERQGMISLIPADTRVLSAVIAGSTARINFSEEFQYNTAGMEGFAAQLIQIIWTATEFPNVQDVQILIEGNRIDHLGEGIPIWNPLNRQSF
jgi:spore germination protein GerM